MFKEEISQMKKSSIWKEYNALVRIASKALVEKETDTSSLALKILKENIHPGSESAKEISLIRSLQKKKFTREMAQRIVQESRSSFMHLNEEKLKEEKKILINSIKMIPHEKFATEDDSILTQLIDCWCRSYTNPHHYVKLENDVISSMVENSSNSFDDPKNDADPLILKIMIKKFNEKYEKMSKSQAEFLKEVIQGKEKESAKIMVNEVKKLLKEKNISNEYVKKKIKDASHIFEGENDDISFFLTVAELKDELKKN